jgi:hypothetical protein
MEKQTNNENNPGEQKQELQQKREGQSVLSRVVDISRVWGEHQTGDAV